MRIASFNVENLFARVRAMDLEEWSDGKGILEEYTRLNTILQKAKYTAADKTAIMKSLGRLGMEKTRESEWAILRENRGRLVRQPQGAPMEVVATGRGDWIGWIELKREAVNEVGTQMTARVIKDIDADVLAVIEADDRTALRRFDDQLLKLTYEHIMLIDGNDERGIDVGIMSKGGHGIDRIVSHVDDPVGKKRLFCRDCPEYTVGTTSGAQLLLMI